MDDLSQPLIRNVSVSPRTEIDRYPLSKAQHDIYIGQQLDPDSPLYNMGMVFSINGALNFGRFATAWSNTVALSDALRIRFYSHETAVLQIDENVSVPLLEFDVADIPNNQQFVESWIDKELNRPISLNGALVGACLFKHSDEKWTFFCKMHHIITDASSYASIWQQLNKEYQTESETPDVITRPYKTYIQKLNSTIDSADVSSATKQAKEYWSEKLIPAPPTYYGMKPTYTRTEASRDSEFFDQTRAESLNALASSSDIRSFSPHLAKFQLLLTLMFCYIYRVSGQSSIAIATTAPNRADKDFKDTPGLFVELLPLTVSIDAEETFLSLHKKVQAEVLAFMKHAVPGASAWHDGKSVSAVLNYVPLSMNRLDNIQVESTWLHAGHMDRQHAMRMHVTDWDDSGDLSLSIDTNDSCFSSDLKPTVAKHWLAVFDAFGKDRDQRLDSFALISDEDRPQYFPNTRNQPASLDENYVVNRFLEMVKHYPDNIAISEAEHSVTYSQMLSAVDHISDQILKHGIGKNDRVAVYLERSMSLPIALMAILKTCAAYVPIENRIPSERVALLLEDADCNLLITSASLYQALPNYKGSALFVDKTGAVVQTIDKRSADKANTNTDLSSDTTAYILYTSGSTGKPKGVVISRSAMANYCSWATTYYSDNQCLTFPLFTAIGFDLTVTSIFVPLLTGGQIRVYPVLDNNVDNSLQDVLSENLVDIIKLTPSHLAMMQNQDWSESRVKQLIVGGEDLKCNLAQNIHQSFKGRICIHNEYGPTEATVGCIVHRFDSEKDTVGSVPIGQPVAAMKALVLNAACQIQPEGVTGTLYLTGPSLADGYLHHSASSTALKDSPFKVLESLDNERFYNTGDSARFFKGHYHYLGREDDQCKIRGARVELAEIESTLLHKTAATHCVAVLIDAISDTTHETERHCTSCGLSSLYPGTTFNAEGMCNICSEFDTYRDKAEVYFKSMQELQAISDKLKNNSTSQYHCMMLLSGGKDSTYALGRLVDLGLNVLAYTLDNGYLSTEAKANIKRVCEALGVDHEFAETPAMREIFADSLQRYSNVCNGCFKTIYTLSLQRAKDLGIGAIVTGLSRGQFFETRLTGELFADQNTTPDKIDATVLKARIAYHRTPDAVNRLLNTEHLKTDDIFNQIQIIDFYRYCDVDLDELFNYLSTRLPWIRPSDTGRSTNCRINDVGIYIHRQEKGFHNYSLPYSWDVRLGHKKRDAALEELNDNININEVETILKEVGYTPASDASEGSRKLALYFTADLTLSPDEIRSQLKTSLPPWMLPDFLVQLDELPVTANGKIAKSKLPHPTHTRTLKGTAYKAPATELEKALCDLWIKELSIDLVGVNDNFFELGGDSLAAIRIISKLNEQGYLLSNTEIFENQTIAALARIHESNKAKVGTQAVNVSVKPFASVNEIELAKLANILNKSQ